VVLERKAAWRDVTPRSVLSWLELIVVAALIPRHGRTL